MSMRKMIEELNKAYWREYYFELLKRHQEQTSKVNGK